MTRIQKTDKRPSQGLQQRPATSVEGRENQVVSLAIDLAEKQIRAGQASSQVITHFLKLGTVRAELEREKLIRENELLRTKSEAIASGKRVEELYQNALDAMKLYSGQATDDEEYDYDDY